MLVKFLKMRSVGKELKHIVSFSGGKDSTAMLLLLLEQNKRIDEVIFFDAGSWEFPQMRQHIDDVEKYTGLKITRINPEHSFDWWFSEHEVSTSIDSKYDRNYKGYGFPSALLRWCTREKIRAIHKYIGKNAVSYIGYAYDERWRADKNKSKTNIYPLVESKITEDKALEMCYDAGFNWGGLYNHFKRVSCWCCPLQRISSLRSLYNLYPELWERLQKMQDISCNSFKPDKQRIEDYGKRFEAEKLQLSLSPNGFEKAEAGGAFF